MTRLFSNTLLFESALDTIGDGTYGNPLLHNIKETLLSPTVEIVEENCLTALGFPHYISYRVEGYLETPSGAAMNPSTLTTYITGGRTHVNIKTLETCTSKGGICRACLVSSRPKDVGVVAGDLYKVIPEMVLDISQHSLAIGQASVGLIYDASQFDNIYVFEDGLLIDDSEYSISGKTLILNTPALVNTVFVIRYVVRTLAQYYHWLCHTYSGSVIGAKQMMNIGGVGRTSGAISAVGGDTGTGGPLLPIPKGILTSYIPQEDIKDLIRNLKALPIREDDLITYIGNIKDPIEQAVYVTLLGAVLLNG